MSTLKKTVLGRGLDALLPKGYEDVGVLNTSPKRDTGENGIIVNVEIDKIHPNPFQPRIDFDPTALEELANSIREKGVIQPITVRRFEAGYQLIAGERRLRAAQMVRLKYIPAYVLTVSSDKEMLELALIENIQREYLNPMEIAVAYQRLIDECHLTQDEVAKRVGKDRTTITNFLRLLKLPQKIQDGLRRNKISMGHARALLGIPNEHVQLRVYERIMEEGLSVRKVEEIARNFGKAKHKKRDHVITNTNVRIEYEYLEAQLREFLGTKVSIQSKGSGRGEIVIEFYSIDDFERLFELLSSVSKHKE
ncbi:MAG: ParB/RepB/Spo0J family partition protein [Bacteroidetes bacterium]|nr:ParB/RepB/Spo0J family partition protein [Bacteroidota bacterium]